MKLIITAGLLSFLFLSNVQALSVAEAMNFLSHTTAIRFPGAEVQVIQNPKKREEAQALVDKQQECIKVLERAPKLEIHSLNFLIPFLNYSDNPLAGVVEPYYIAHEDLDDTKKTFPVLQLFYNRLMLLIY